MKNTLLLLLSPVVLSSCVPTEPLPILRGEMVSPGPGVYGGGRPVRSREVVPDIDPGDRPISAPTVGRAASGSEEEARQADAPARRACIGYIKDAPMAEIFGALMGGAEGMPPRTEDLMRTTGWLLVHNNVRDYLRTSNTVAMKELATLLYKGLKSADGGRAVRMARSGEIESYATQLGFTASQARRIRWLTEDLFL